VTVILTVAILSSLFGFALDYRFVSAVRDELKKFAPEQRGAVVFADKTMRWAKRGLFLGPVLMILPFVWVFIVFDYVPNTVAGATVLFGPAGLLLLSGGGLFLFSQCVKIWAYNE
jgi:hypothetical protein